MKGLYFLAAFAFLPSAAVADADALTVCLAAPLPCLQMLNTQVLPNLSGRQKAEVEIPIAKALAALGETTTARAMATDASAELMPLMAGDRTIIRPMTELALVWWAVGDAGKARETLHISMDYAEQEDRPDLKVFDLFTLAGVAITVEQPALARDLEASALALLPMVGRDTSFALMPYPKVLAMTGRAGQARDVARVMANHAIAASALSDAMRAGLALGDEPSVQAAASELKGLCLGDWWTEIDFDPIIASLAMAGYRDAATDCLDGAAQRTGRVDSFDNANGDIDEELMFYVLALDAVGRTADRDRNFLRIHDGALATRALAQMVLRRNGGF